MRGLPLTTLKWLNPNYSLICILSYRLYSNYSQGRLFLATSRRHKFLRAEDEGRF